MIEYQTLKLEYKLKYKTDTSTNNLAILLSKYLKSDIPQILKFLEKSISKTDNPIQLLKLLKLK